MLVTLCGLQAQSSAQVHVGLSFGKGGTNVHASVGPITFASGSSSRVNHAPRVSHRRTFRRPARRDHRPDYVPDFRRDRARTCVVQHRVWVPGYYETIRVPPVYRTTFNSCGERVRVQVRAGFRKRVFHEGYWKTVRKRVGRRH